jgi:eukaryotic-like serine/threonine-protein kinase
MLTRNGNERERIKALERYRILDSFPEPAFERLTELVAEMFRTPVALISLVHQDRVWFKSHWGTGTREIPRSVSFCSEVILGEQVLVIPDTATDPRTANRAGVERFRFYAGAPLRTLDRYNIGTLCVLDTKPRQDWTAFKSRVLSDLAAITVDEMELRRMATGRWQMESAVRLRQLDVAALA